MNTAQHTPGPWTMDRGTPLVVMDRRGAYVAQCDGISATIGSEEEMTANAHLIYGLALAGIAYGLLT